MKIKYLLPALVLTILLIIPSLNLLHAGFPITHDGDVHLVRLTNFYQSLQEGILIPRWAAHVNWGYGQPIFEFFYPLPYYLGSLLHIIGFHLADGLKLLLGLSLVLSGLTMYLWVAKTTNKWAGCIAGFLYVFAPFRFVDVYVRGDVGESLAFIFIPLVLYWMYLLQIKKSRKIMLLGGITFAVLILCHNIASLMSLPFFIFYGWYLWHTKTNYQKSYLLQLVILFGVGFLLSAFFWVPGLFEAKYVLRDFVSAGEYAKRFVTFSQILYGSWSYDGTGYFTVQLGIAQWLVFVASIFALPFVYKKYKNHFLLVSMLVIYVLVGIFFMLPISNIIWAKIQLLQDFQFPWRFLIITTFASAALGGIISSFLNKRWQFFMGVCIVVIGIGSQYTYWHAKGYHARPDNYFAGVFDGPGDTGESSPIWGIRFMESGFTSPLETISGTAQVTVIKHAITQHTYTVVAKTKVRLLENTMYFPGWSVTVDGKNVPIEFQDQMHRGIITFWIDPGKHIIQVRFTETKLRLFADYISSITIVIVGIGLIFL